MLFLGPTWIQLDFLVMVIVQSIITEEFFRIFNLLRRGRKFGSHAMHAWNVQFIQCLNNQNCSFRVPILVPPRLDQSYPSDPRIQFLRSIRWHHRLSSPFVADIGEMVNGLVGDSSAILSEALRWAGLMRSILFHTSIVFFSTDGRIFSRFKMSKTFSFWYSDSG